MIKKGTNAMFYALVTDNGYYVRTSDPSDLTKDIHRATVYEGLGTAKACRTRALEKLTYTYSNGSPSYFMEQFTKHGAKEIHIAEVVIQQYKEIVI